MELRANLASDWPALGWLAHCRERGADVFHGPRVEASDDAMSEAVWAGSFENAAFDEAAVVAGSGIRRRDGALAFVSSTSTVDRLYSIEVGDGALVSNSLPCLLEAAGADLDPHHEYGKELSSIVKGLTSAVPFIPTSAGRVQLTYFHNLVWDGADLAIREKPEVGSPLASFAEYRNFLSEQLDGIASNMTSESRRHPYAWLGTLSSGYDANAATALAVEFGCDEAVCFDISRTGEPDDGEPVARALGIRPLRVSRAEWRADAARHAQLPDVPFFAATPAAGLAPFGAVGPRLGGRVLLTGFYGDSIWDRDAKDVSPDVVRKDASGLTFTEFRLRAGFINCAPTFWAARNVKDVVAVSRSQEMRPWIAGKKYQRPIPRRILEESGVPRKAFGQAKRPGVGGGRLSERDFLTAPSMADYLRWLRKRRRELGVSRLSILPAVDRARWTLAATALTGARRARGIRRVRRMPLRRRVAVAAKAEQARRTPIRRYVFPWAIERAREAYPAPDGLRASLRGARQERPDR